MNRAQHYRTAERILADVERRVSGRGVPAQELAARVSLAQVHATLATVSLDVEGRANAIAGTGDDPS